MTSWNKNIYRSLLILSFVGLNAVILWGLGEVWVFWNSGADKASILHTGIEVDDSNQPEIEWAILENQGRPMEKQTLLDIERDYVRSWYVRSVAMASNDSYGLDDYYTDSLRSKLYQVLQLNKANGITLEETTLAHHPVLEFYSTDGTLVVFSDHNVESYHEVWQGGEMLHAMREIKSYQVMMLLEDGFWRVRHLVEDKHPSSPIKEIRDLGSPQIESIKGLNYYPAQTPWNIFGSGFNEEIIKEDFARIRGMGLNTIRIFVPYEAFGKEKVTEDKQSKLMKVFDMAASMDLKVLVTLFDFYGNYDLMDWTATHRHAETLVKLLKGHPALLGWDIKNEPDLDFDSRGKRKVLAWLEEMIYQISKWDRGHPVTIGWSSPQAADLLADKVHFISFHYYDKPNQFQKTYSSLKEKAGNTPILLSEFGISSYSGFWNAFSGSEQEQKAYYTEMTSVLKQQEIPFMFWTLYDFKEVPKEVVGRYPWRRQPQKYFGCVTVEGLEKPSFKVLDQTPVK
ncbi:MAG: cellulase family glycosylhydrolase [Eudoraea sp.]|uniref:cellulase family glycosylhydrolase n=1 Tax=Eudoraea sp. TaxID=1979955 RepID=UPI003C796EF4